MEHNEGNKFMALSTHMKNKTKLWKVEEWHINNLKMHLYALGKQEEMTLTKVDEKKTIKP